MTQPRIRLAEATDLAAVNGIYDHYVLHSTWSTWSGAMSDGPRTGRSGRGQGGPDRQNALNRRAGTAHTGGLVQAGAPPLRAASPPSRFRVYSVPAIAFGGL